MPSSETLGACSTKQFVLVRYTTKHIGIPLFTFEDPVRTNSSSQPTYSGIHHGLDGLVAEVGTDSDNFMYVDPGGQGDLITG